jgi:2-amino-4-hydroxy-6-hydroxymethyldihydropteridine diphosphokinase
MTGRAPDPVSDSRLPTPGSRVFLGLGANIGDRRRALDAALQALAGDGRVRVTRRSSLYETAPVGMVDQPWFLNVVVEIATPLSPEALLDLAQQVERDLGRTREIRWGPRTVDIDILLFGDRVMATPRLTIPHPEMSRRRFVVEPLVEIAPELRLPDGRRVRDLLEDLTGQEVRRVDAL